MCAVKKQEKRSRLGERNEKIREFYLKEINRGFRNDFIIDKLEKMYFLDKYTLEAIVWKKGVYAEF